MSAAAAAWRPPPARRVRALRDRLALTYGRPAAQPHGHPIAELVLTVLSQSTNDRNRDVAYLAMRRRWPTWTAVRDAPPDELVETLRPGGLAPTKAPRIQAILRALPEADGEPSLDHLARLPVDNARAELVALPGVGRKTAACVLCFTYGMHDIPVDTHVSRVGQRLALLRPGSGFDEQHDAMLRLTPPGAALEWHINLLRHGRRTCHARVPDCPTCALARMCPSRRS
jgi:endonuclease-3